MEKRYLFLLSMWGIFYFALTAQQKITDIVISPENPKTYDVSPLNLLFNESIKFSAVVTPKAENDSVSYLWEFGDGGTSPTFSASHDYNKPVSACSQSYTVRLTVFNYKLSDDGKSFGLYNEDTLEKTIVVYYRPQPLINSDSYFDPSFIEEEYYFKNCRSGELNPDSVNYTIALDNKTDGSCLNSNTYSIFWGDGEKLENISSEVLSNAEHAYSSYGSFTLRIRVFSAEGVVGEKTYSVINDANPVMGLPNPGSTVGCAPLVFTSTINKYEKNSVSTEYYFWIDSKNNEPIKKSQQDVNESGGNFEYIFNTTSCGIGTDNAHVIYFEANNGCLPTKGSIEGIYVSTPPTAKFDVTDKACPNEDILFQNISISSSSLEYNCEEGKGEIYEWDFGDGEISTTQKVDVTHVYNQPGVYKVFLKAYARQGCTVASFDSATIIVQPEPVSSFAFTKEGNCLSKLTLLARSENTDTYIWEINPNSGFEFLEGASLSSENPQIQFTVAGEYTIRLLSSNSCKRDVPSATETIIVPYKPVLERISDLDLCKGAYLVTADVIDEEDFYDDNYSPIVSYNWVVINEMGIERVVSDEPLPEILFDSVGVYTVRVTVENKCGISSGQFNVNVLGDVDPQATLNGQQTDGILINLNGSVNFVDITDGGKSRTWKVSPADGASPTESELETARFDFNEARDYVVEQVVTNGCDTAMKAYAVSVSGDFNAVVADFPEVCQGSVLDLAAYVTYFDNNNKFSVEWHVEPNSHVEISDTNALYPTIQFMDEGEYEIWVVLKDNNSTKEFETIKKKVVVLGEVEAGALVDQMVNNKVFASIDETIVFKDASTGNISDYNWTSTSPDDVDIKYSTSKSPEIAFYEPGDYTITQMVYNFCDTSVKTYDVTVRGEVQIVFEDLPDLCLGEQLDVRSFLRYELNKNTVRYQWTVSPVGGVDILYDTSAIPQISFAEAGIFTITISLYDKESDLLLKSSSQNINVYGPLEASAVLDKTFGKAPLMVEFSSTSKGFASNFEWIVDIPNGVSIVSPNEEDTEIYFTQPGNYKVIQKIWNTCDTSTNTYDIKVIGEPTVVLESIDPVNLCDEHIFSARLKAAFSYQNDSLKIVEWNVTQSDGLTDGFAFENGTLKNDTFPDIRFFKTGISYTVSATMITKYVTEGVQSEVSFFLMEKPTIDISATDTLICLATLQQVQFNDYSLGDSLKYFWQVDEVDGWSFESGYDETSTNNALLFNKVGTYHIHVSIQNRCGLDTANFVLVVKDVPEVHLNEDLPKEACLNVDSTFVLNLKDYVSYEWNNNLDSVIWEITADSLVYEFLNGTSDTSLHPEIKFYGAGEITIEANANSVCGVSVANANILLLNNIMEASFVNTITESCLPIEIQFNRNSIGDEMTFEWQILKNGLRFEPEDLEWLSPDSAEDVRIRFQKWGDYEVSLIEQNFCKTDTFTQQLHLYQVPEIVKFDNPIAQCGTSAYSASDYFEFLDGGSETSVLWNVTRNGDFWLKSNEHFPVLDFPYSGEYEISNTLNNACGIAVDSSILVKVDSVYVLNIGENYSTCLNAPEISLRDSNYNWGTWRCLEDEVRINFDSIDTSWNFKTNIAGIYTVEYALENGACVIAKSKTIEIKGLPQILASDTSVCINNLDDILLQYSPKGGYWEGEGVSPKGIFRMDRMDTVEIGDYELSYIYEDSVTTCSNIKNITVSVEPAPVPQFNLEKARACIFEPVLFYPKNVEGIHEIIWDFGDGSRGSLSADDEVMHVYSDTGNYQVKAVFVSQYGCVDSISHSLRVLGNPPNPYFTFDAAYGHSGFPNKGCAPFNPRLVVDEAPYKKYEAYSDTLVYAWDFGNGRSYNGLTPPTNLLYNQGLEDTVYYISLTVQNSCFSQTYIDSVIVEPRPIASFVMMHKWDCSPVDVEFQNLSGGLPEKFYWDFGDGTTSGKEWPTHQFTTDSVSKVFTVRLVAENNCGTDTFVQNITIKPSTIFAHFSVDKRVVCVGEPVTFSNHSSYKSDKIVFAQWDFGDGVEDTSGQDIVHAYNKAGKYAVKLEVNNYCGFDIIEDSILVEPVPEVEIISVDATCANVPLQFSLTTDQDIGAYRWYFDQIDTVNISNPNYLFTESGIHTIKAEVLLENSLAKCKGVGEKQVEVFPVPVDSIFPEVADGCSPFLYKPEIKGTGKYYSWSFNSGDEFELNSNFEYQNQTDSLQRHVVRAVSENEYGCIDTVRAHVIVRPQSQTQIQKEILEEYPEKVIFYNFTENSSTCIWVHENGDSVYSCNDHIRYFSNNGTYTVKLITWNQFGCASADSLSHETNKFRLYFPNTFIPALPSSEVNVFRGVGMGLDAYHLEIYDRWNNKLWETDKVVDGKPAEGWDGTNKDGKPMPQDVYFWRCWTRFKDQSIWQGMPSGKNDEMKTQGTITLIR